MSSFVCDWFIRQKILTNMNMFYVYQIPVPRLTAADPRFAPIVERAARLICTTPEFDDLAQEVGLKPHPHTLSPNPSPASGRGELIAGEGVNRYGDTNPVERAKLRAELDGLVAHLYDLTEAEFAHILATFPLVKEPVKVAALNAYRDVERGLVR